MLAPAFLCLCGAFFLFVLLVGGGIVLYFTVIRPSRRGSEKKHDQADAWHEDQTGGWDEGKSSGAKRPPGSDNDAKS